MLNRVAELEAENKALAESIEGKLLLAWLVLRSRHDCL